MYHDFANVELQVWIFNTILMHLANTSESARNLLPRPHLIHVFPFSLRPLSLPAQAPLSLPMVKYFISAPNLLRWIDALTCPPKQIPDAISMNCSTLNPYVYLVPFSLFSHLIISISLLLAAGPCPGCTDQSQREATSASSLIHQEDQLDYQRHIQCRHMVFFPYQSKDFFMESEVVSSLIVSMFSF